MAGRKRRRSNILVRIAILCIITYAALALIGTQVQVSAKRRQLKALEADIQRQELLNAEAARLLSLGDDEKYIERIARDKLGFAYPDERIFIDRSGN